MTNDTHNRDTAVDRLLAVEMPRGLAASAGACLDADTLAAWADQALDAGERAAAEAHAADCARCQAMLAAMVKTAPAPQAAASPWRLPAFGWLIPVATAAAAVIVWTIVPAREPGPVNVRQVSQSAETSAPPVAGPATPEAGASSAQELAGRKANRDQEPSVEAKDVEADKKTPASVEANAVSDAPARADARLEKALTPVPGSASAPATPSPALAARVFSVGALETVIVSSNPASRWRIVPGGAVQRSADGGSTWQTQSTGVSETLSAGASPSPSVCWLVGPGGIVLLSTDGRSWTRVAFPEAVQLVAIRADDAEAATVTTADGREFVTEDGGRTWTRAPAL